MRDRGEAPGKERYVPDDNGKPDGLTPWERFVQATRRVISVPKAELDRREAEWRKRRRATKRRQAK